MSSPDVHLKIKTWAAAFRGESRDAVRSAFQQLEFGRAFAIGIVLTLVIMAITAVQFRLSRRFVFYQ